MRALEPRAAEALARFDGARPVPAPSRGRPRSEEPHHRGHVRHRQPAARRGAAPRPHQCHQRLPQGARRGNPGRRGAGAQVGLPVLTDLFTIGYEGATLDGVLAALRGAGVDLLVDVRAVPRSRKPGFSSRLLAASAEAQGIAYRHLQRLGTPKPGRDAARKGDAATMTRIFAGHMEGDEPQAALAEATALAAARPACLLCFERDPHFCHRTIVAEMIAKRTGQRIVHLTPP
ncbi:MAG: DUF488 domain-containing protein [Proteobacteria bacterium]|nr:DUF488 domain-containing protein [Pseudomonadota bacterium]